jgi:endonuclease/exonuclease/phosphatase family metal-dependent hydrolase
MPPATHEPLGGAGPERRARRIRVVTLNLLHGAPIPAFRRARSSLDARLDWTAERIAEAEPDVVLLQEASITPQHGNTAARLAEGLGMEHVYARANPSPLWSVVSLGGRVPRSLAFEEGPAVLSRLPIVARRVHRLSSPLTLHASACSRCTSPRSRAPAAAARSPRWRASWKRRRARIR